MSKYQFLLKTLVKTPGSVNPLPYCNSDRTTVLRWKNRILQLRRCDECSLSFRFPKDEPGEIWASTRKSTSRIT